MICVGCGKEIPEDENLFVIGKVPREYCWNCYENSREVEKVGQ